MTAGTVTPTSQTPSYGASRAAGARTFKHLLRREKEQAKPKEKEREGRVCHLLQRMPRSGVLLVFAGTGPIPATVTKGIHVRILTHREQRRVLRNRTSLQYQPRRSLLRYHRPRWPWKTLPRQQQWGLPRVPMIQRGMPRLAVPRPRRWRLLRGHGHRRRVSFGTRPRSMKSLVQPGNYGERPERSTKDASVRRISPARILLGIS